MATDDEMLQRAIIGIPRVAARIVKLPDEQKAKALEAVELSYLQTVSNADCTESHARDWVGAVMDTLRAEVADRARDETGHDGFASVERLMKLLVGSGPAA